MLKIIGRVLQWLRGETLKLLIYAGILLIIWGIIAPVGTLSWWLSAGTQALGLDINPTPDLIKKNALAGTGDKNCYIVFLPGVGDFSANELTPGEEIFLNQLAKLHPQCAIVDDVFPYSAANKSLGGQRFLAPVWRFASKEHGWLKNADVLIKIRNLWRFAISADGRYSSVYNLGIANAIAERMNAASPLHKGTSEQPIKIILVGTSGGAQVSLGAAEYLNNWLNARLILVSIGGSFDGETGFNQIERAYHLRGSRDWVEDITKVVFADRWSWTINSPFIQAVRQGRYQVVETGSHTHDGKNGYFSTLKIENTDITYVGLLLDKVNQLPIWDD